MAFEILRCKRKEYSIVHRVALTMVHARKIVVLRTFLMMLPPMGHVQCTKYVGYWSLGPVQVSGVTSNVPIRDPYGVQRAAGGFLVA